MSERKNLRTVGRVHAVRSLAMLPMNAILAALLPVVAAGQPAPAVQVRAGAGHHCAVLVDGSLWCWGSGGYGRLGDGTDQDRSTPVRVSDLPAITQVAPGNLHTCALDVDGSVW